LKPMSRSLGYRVEEGVLAVLIMLNILEFLYLLPADVHIVKKLISWAVLGYLLYRVSLTDVFFGATSKALDLTLIFSFFMLIFKNLLALFSHNDLTFLSILGPVLIAHEHVYFQIGSAMLIAAALWAAVRMPVKSPSVLHVLKVKPSSSYMGILLRTWIILCVFIAFFIIVFNLAMEWLAIAVDASLLVLAILFYMFTMFRRHIRRLNPDQLLHKVGTVGEDFYARFVGLFHSRRGIFLGIAGMLVLHLLTDAGVFIIPYLLGFKTSYFGEMHEHTLYQLFASDVASAASPLSTLAVGWVYVFNIIALVLMLLIPGYIWFKLYTRKGFSVTRIGLAVFYCSLIVAALAPVFSIERLASGGVVVGTNIVLHGVESYFPLVAVFATSLAFASVILLLSRIHSLKKAFLISGIVAIDVFVALYISLYFTDLSMYYLQSILHLAMVGQFFILCFMVMFYLVTITFYVGGFFIFVIETKQEFRHIR
jgi:hypothetical protein